VPSKICLTTPLTALFTVTRLGFSGVGLYGWRGQSFSLVTVP
jgi:hypothetical protein